MRLAPLLTAVLMLLAACSVVEQSPPPQLAAGARWALLPLVNHTGTPQAGLRATAIAETLLHGMGFTRLTRYPDAAVDAILDPAGEVTPDQALDWAKKQNARYALTGSVNEWRYKVGVDGEPAVSVALRVVDLQTGAVVWSGVGAKSGWSRQSLGGVAQRLLADLLDGLRA